MNVRGCGLSDVFPHDANPGLFSRPDCFPSEGTKLEAFEGLIESAGRISSRSLMVFAISP